MANCFFCGKSAGFLKKKHPECEEQQAEGWTRMIAVAAEAVRQRASHVDVRARVSDIAAASFNLSRVEEAIARGWEQSVDHLLEDGHLDENEETHLAEVAGQWALAQADLDTRGAYSRLVKCAIIRDMLKGVVPKRVKVEGSLPFNFQKGEELLWVFPSVKYYEDRKRRRYVGSSQGVSIRIAKGVYYRVGAFQGHPIETTETVPVGVGMLAVTTKHLYFAGPKSVRIAHSKIVVIQPYDNGVGVHRDAQSAGLQLFVTGDGWFTYNLLMNVSSVV